MALILDVLGIAQRSGVFGESREEARSAEKQKAKVEIEKQRLLLFKSGSFERLAVPLSLVARLEEFPRSAVEHAGGGLVIQYRDRILPLVFLQPVLEPNAPGGGELSDPVQVVVFNDGDHSMGMVVDEIVDVAEEAVTIRRKSARKGLLGSAVVAKKDHRFPRFEPGHRFGPGQLVPNYGPVRGLQEGSFIADPSAFSRGMIRSGLDMAGYAVREATNLDEAISSLETPSGGHRSGRAKPAGRR